eukprot:TRINITY_DN26537_c0_g2_i1.p1 TRINITY_DN26537_c0_g2~~TRINITY_DN26537_c0_g2_i1.p1  ORF type:complete len:585 (+),score=101.26 TRINITY_DN26537_c0_g2_i1:218-1756(+)
MAAARSHVGSSASAAAAAALRCDSLSPVLGRVSGTDSPLSPLLDFSPVSALSSPPLPLAGSSGARGADAGGKRCGSPFSPLSPPLASRPTSAPSSWSRNAEAQPASWSRSSAVSAEASGAPVAGTTTAASSSSAPAASRSPPPKDAEMSKTMWQIEDFDVGARIGSGSFGDILLARERESRTVVVLKAMRKRRIERYRVQRHVSNEIRIQEHLRHPGVLRLHGFFWDDVKIYMILEPAPFGDLAKALRKQPGGCFAEPFARLCILQVADAIAYCHEKHVMHRDIKPANVLIARGGQLKLGDFGWAAHTIPGEQRWTLCGTLDYLPPEMVHVTRGHGFEVDVWSLGILAYELLVGEPPFADPCREETYRRILAASPSFPDELPAAGAAEPPSPATKAAAAPTPASTDARDFVRRLLQRVPQERPTPAELMAHGWLASAAAAASSSGSSAARAACGVAGAAAASGAFSSLDSSWKTGEAAIHPAGANRPTPECVAAMTLAAREAGQVQGAAGGA